MTDTFEAVVRPDDTYFTSIDQVTPQSPFNHPAYAKAQERQGAIPCAFLLSRAGSVINGCAGFLKGESWNTRLIIPTTPSVAPDSVFWDGVERFCKERHIASLSLESFASTEAVTARYRWPKHIQNRFEYTVDLDSTVVADSLSNQNKRNVNKAMKRGIDVRCTRDHQDCVAHVQMMQSSMERRIGRGEDVTVPTDHTPFSKMLDSGIGQVFQAISAGQVLASILILRTPTCAYYQSAGALPEGMRIGASPYLIQEVAATLSRDGVRWFNLGGAWPDAEGLRRFKKGFGASELNLITARYIIMPRYIRLIRKITGRIGHSLRS